GGILSKVSAASWAAVALFPDLRFVAAQVAVSTIERISRRVSGTREALETFGDQPKRETLDLSLACPVPPFETDGTWDAVTERVVWRRARIPTPQERAVVHRAS